MTSSKPFEPRKAGRIVSTAEAWERGPDAAAWTPEGTPPAGAREFTRAYESAAAGELAGVAAKIAGVTGRPAAVTIALMLSGQRASRLAL